MAERLTGDLPYQAGEGWIQIRVRVQPRASRNGVTGVVEGTLRVNLTAPPVEGKANRALQGFLAQLLGIAKSNVEIVAGETSRSKRVRLHGVSPEDLAHLMAETGHG